MKSIEVNKMGDHYEIGVNGQFYCSCDNIGEVREEIKKLEEDEQS